MGHKSISGYLLVLQEPICSVVLIGLARLPPMIVVDGSSFSLACRSHVPQHAKQDRGSIPSH